MAQFIIPTIYTAVDRMTAPVLRMQTAVANLGTVAVRAQRQFNNILPNMDAAVKNRLNFMVSMAKTMAFIGAGMLTVDSLMQYEKELANLKALTGVTGKEFQRFKDIIQSTAKETKTSAVEVAQGFTTIANAMPQLLTSADGLGKVTSASILLAKAARMELTPAADAVTTLLNQFGKGAEHAAGLVDMMAAGSKYGSAEIEDLSQSLREFGKQAVISGVSLRESITLTELVSQFRKGSQAGIEMRNVLIEMSKGAAQDPKALKDMQRLGVNIALVANNATPISVRLKELQKIMGDSTALFHIFGKENQAMAIALLQNADRFETLNQQLGETGVAARMAEENTQTLYYALIELKAAWVNIVTASRGGNLAMTVLGGAVRFLGKHLGTIVNIATPFIGFLVAWRVGIWAISMATKIATAATVVFNGMIGLTAGLLGTNTLALYSSEVAWYAYVAGAYAANAATVIFGNTLKGVLATIAVMTAGLFLIWQYRKEIQNAANDSTLGRQYNALIGDKQAVQESLERMYLKNPEQARKYINTPGPTVQNQLKGLNMDSVFNRIDQGLPLGNDNDILIQQKKFEEAKSKEDSVIHLTVNVDKNGGADVKGRTGTNSPIPVTVKQTGWPQ